MCVKFLYLFLLSSENRLHDKIHVKILGDILVVFVFVNLQPNISYISSLYGYSLLYPDAKLESKGWLSLFMYILDC